MNTTTATHPTGGRIVRPKKTQWIWPEMIPANRLTVIDGRPNAGKSLLCRDIMARYSTGSDWPSGELCTAGDVGYATDEEGIESSREDLSSAGVDLGRVAMCRAPFPRIGDRPGRPGSASIDSIREIIRRRSLRLLVVDPLSAETDCDDWIALTLLARNTKCAIVAARQHARIYRPERWSGGEVLGVAEMWLDVHIHPRHWERRLIRRFRAGQPHDRTLTGFTITKHKDDDGTHFGVDWTQP